MFYGFDLKDRATRHSVVFLAWTFGLCSTFLIGLLACALVFETVRQVVSPDVFLVIALGLVTAITVLDGLFLLVYSSVLVRRWPHRFG